MGIAILFERYLRHMSGGLRVMIYWAFQGFKETTQDGEKWTLLWAGICLKPCMMGALAASDSVAWAFES